MAARPTDIGWLKLGWSCFITKCSMWMGTFIYLQNQLAWVFLKGYMKGNHSSKHHRNGVNLEVESLQDFVVHRFRHPTNIAAKPLLTHPPLHKGSISTVKMSWAESALSGWFANHVTNKKGPENQHPMIFLGPTLWHHKDLVRHSPSSYCKH